MTILVTGATGRVGSRFVPRLLRLTTDVRVLVRDAAKAQGLGAEVVLGDLTDPDSVDRALEGVDAVVHLAAAIRGVTEEEAVSVNHAATVGLAESVLRAGVGRFVYASTTLLYGAGRGRPAHEDDELAPEMGGAYARSKAAAEKVLQGMEGLPLRTARLAFVYGDGDPHLGESLMWARTWPLHKRLHMVHHADVSQALIRLLMAEGIDGTTVNVADDAPVTALELLRLNGERPDADAGSRVLDDPWESIADTAKIRRELGFRPIHPTVYSAVDAGAL